MRRYFDFPLAVCLAVIVFFATGASRPAALSPYAEALAKIINFDRKVLIMLKEESGANIQRLVGYDENEYQIVVDGVCVAVPNDRTEMILKKLRKKLRPLKYMAFVVEMNPGIKTDKIGVVKGTDQYEILRIMHTADREHAISNEDVIERLKGWQKISSFDLLGADNDWVKLEFKTLPKELKAFTEELYDFCQGAVGQGTPAGLAKEIRQTKRLFLSWN